MYILRKNRGFTLIELVIVIVILSVLAITAAPKFIDISGDARKSSLKALEAAIYSQSELAHIACQVTEGCMTATWGQIIYVPSLGQKVQMLRGYPDGGEINRTDQIDDLVQYSGYEISAVSHTTVRWSIEGTNNCYVQYRQPADPNNLDDDGDNIGGNKPIITRLNTGC